MFSSCRTLPLLLDHLPEVRLGGRHNPDIDWNRLGSADALELSLLQGPQQLDLQLVRKVVDVVDEDGAPVGALEVADVLPVGARERALLMAEDGALEEALRDDPAVDGDEGAVGTRAGAVQRPGHQLLARAAFSLDEHGGFSYRDQLQAKVGENHVELDLRDPTHPFGG